MVFNRNGFDFSIKLYFLFFSRRTTQPYYYFIKKRQSFWTHQQIATILLIPTPASNNSTQNDVFKIFWSWKGGVLLNWDWSLHSSWIIVATSSTSRGQPFTPSQMRWKLGRDISLRLLVLLPKTGGKLANSWLAPVVSPQAIVIRISALCSF